MDVVTLAARPDVAEGAFGIPYGTDAPAFMQGEQVALLMRRERLARRWGEYVVAALDADGMAVARGVSVPFAANTSGREPFPAGGWDQVAVWAAEDALDEAEPDTVCALEIAVHPDHRNHGLSGLVLDAMRDNTRRLGFGRLVAPVRPPARSSEPLTPMESYIKRVRGDGLPSDYWLRLHVRHGGQIIGVAPCSAVVQAPLPQWCKWTGLPFDADGEVLVPGALAPVWVSVRMNIAVYVEPNVWVLHPVDG